MTKKVLLMSGILLLTACGLKQTRSVPSDPVSHLTRIPGKTGIYLEGTSRPFFSTSVYRTSIKLNETEEHRIKYSSETFVELKPGAYEFKLLLTDRSNFVAESATVAGCFQLKADQQLYLEYLPPELVALGPASFKLIDVETKEPVPTATPCK
ncbi:hypothetical protein EHQ12_11305 [Leptospira gomenensis]|uniref:Uncharacterized protein n=1 Tax=Leptospira gomenensis TaxID=2484974 RepID=A0A5F1Y9V0_9LEPT|nr:hypothetical protein [Leptospira gomenensis]TGK33344.1 hypothetical protein EHQ17_11165 [Leptospira gomenensis]TGK37361.1 hypothetical protein EHQ12_11305 [Leptospira gomenensis]TGK40550.1 hypothetical protein EHQ07_18350 [Leptospira gomenensis]TGK56472.1 hypothetical protein EHQ13_14915 [Leptospira gomenensis]